MARARENESVITLIVGWKGVKPWRLLFWLVSFNIRYARIWRYILTDCFTPLLHTSASHLCFTPLRHTLASHLCFTPLLHTSASHLCFTPLLHTTASHPCVTPLLHTSASHLCFTPLLHTSASHLCFTPLRHTTASHHCFTPLLHTTASHHCSTPLLHTTASHLCSTPLLHTSAPHHCFTPLLHTTASHHCFTPLLHTSGSLVMSKWAVMIGVLIVLDALIISLIRGTPCVMFIEATPAKWNVFSVICVPGSPIDWAQIAPTAVPTNHHKDNALSRLRKYMSYKKDLGGCHAFTARIMILLQTSVIRIPCVLWWMVF